MKRALAIAFLVCVAASSWAMASDVGFIEDFALAPDRAKPLAQLIPGTEDYYYYNCLYLQQKGDFAKVDDLLKLWIARYQYTPRVKEVQLRQALLSYEQDPAKSLGFITQHMNLLFNHQHAQILGQKPDLPVALDQALVGRDALTKLAMARYQNLDGFEDVALESLAAAGLDGDRRRDLVRRLHRPDVANLVQIVAADLEYKNSGGFGQFEIHHAMLLPQLEDLLKLKPELLNQDAFVQAYMAKLVPSPDEDWRNDPKAKAAFLDRQWSFVSRLSPAHNSLKAHVLYNRLAFDRSQGVYDKERFEMYLKLPRPMFYMNVKYLQVEENRRYPANLNGNFDAFTLMPPIVSDEPLVRDYLMHFLLDAADYKAYLETVNDVYLKEVFAETKIVNGIGDVEQWYSLLPPDKVKALKERVDIDFVPTNKTQFAPEEPVKLEVDVKNVPKLLVRVFEINALNFYRDNLREVGTDINLDGLVANQEKPYEFKDVPPLLRKRFTIPAEDLPALKNRGVYVVEIIGNGKSSRALVFKGRLYFLQRPSVAGHVLTVLDESNHKVELAKVWMAGHEYSADKDGRIAIPYTAQPSGQKIILISGPLASLAELRHEAETYRLGAAFHVEREALLKGRKATLAIRPSLTVNGMPAPLALLEEVSLVVSSADHDGVATTKEVSDFKLFPDKESTFEFNVPDRLSAIGFTLKAKVKNLSKNVKEDLAASRQFTLNQIDKTEKVEDLHFTRTDAGYVVDLLGLTGEVKPDRAVHFAIKHREYRQPVQVSLKTDAAGRITLGALKDIVSVTATGPEGTSHTWFPPEDERTYPADLCAKAGAPIYVPYMGAAQEPAPAAISLLETRGGTFAKDWLPAVKIKDGFLVLEGLPAGDYDLLIKPEGVKVHILVADGPEAEGYVNSPTRRLEVVNPSPLQIVSASAEGDKIVIRLANTTKESRVHVAATRYMPEYPIFGDLAIGTAGPYVVPVDKLSSLYISGRNIGDEYRYIIDRKAAVKFPGNMLTRPALILNPWSVRKTEAGKEVAAAGEAYARAPQPVVEQALIEHEAQFSQLRSAERMQLAQLADLDYLPSPAAVLLNLRPDDKGVVTIDRKDLTDQNDHLNVQVLAVDSESTVYRQIILPTVAEKHLPAPFGDLRLPKSLDPKKHFAEQKRITALDKGEKLTIADASSAKLEVYDDLASVYRLYVTLSGNATLAEFSFVTGWNKLAPEKKRELYSKYACHELNFFLSKKDPAFFETVVGPYLRNKKDKTFMDLYLVGEDKDLAPYLQPWMYEQLNTAERVLLAKRIQAERANIVRNVKDALDLIPPDLNRFNHLFLTALRGKALETSDATMMFDLKGKTGALADRPSAAGAPVALVNGAFHQLQPPGANGALADRAARRSVDGLEAGEMEKERAEAPASPAAPPAKPTAAPAATRARAAGAAPAGGGMGGGARMDALKDDMQKRELAEQLYRKLDKTEEWAENNYYHLTIGEQNSGLVSINPFWNDYAAFDDGAQAPAAGSAPAKKLFLSTNLAEASHTFSEMMIALAVLDLPFEAAKHDLQQKDRTVTLTAGSPAIVFHKEIQEAPGEASNSILVSQNFYRYGERYIQVGNEQVDHFLSDEFLTGAVYGCQVVITNPTSSKQKIEVLLQVPAGSIPVLNGQETRSVRMDLEPYHTSTMDYYFYFPKPGTFDHYPLLVAKEGKFLAAEKPFTFKVLDKLTKEDKDSWDYISQADAPGAQDKVLDFLKANNLGRVNLNRIAWRMADKDFFGKVIALLSSRKVYNHTLWSYGIKHNDVAAIRQYLLHCEGFLGECGDWIESRLVTIDPVLRKTYQHLEYAPLVNARAHQLGKRRQIVNERLAGQYAGLLKILGYRPKLDQEDLMAVVYYLLLQDRVEEAKGFFAQVDRAKLSEQVQYDYFNAYIDFYSDQPKLAREIATKYKDYGVDRWRKLFGEVASQLDQIEGKAPAVIDEENRQQQQTELAAKSPSLDLKVESRRVLLTYQNLAEVTVNYYLMDVELMFSTAPFVQQQGGQFSYIKPNKTVVVKLPPTTTPLVEEHAVGQFVGGTTKIGTHAFDLPADFTNSNVLVEVVGGGLKRSQAYYSNSLAVELVENYGQVRVADEKGKALPKTYVKVYARMKDGSVAFYKDGYTDLRGRFDYSSLNTDELDRVEKFSMLILSDDGGKGAIVKEASPPKR